MRCPRCPAELTVLQTEIEDRQGICKCPVCHTVVISVDADRVGMDKLVAEAARRALASQAN